MISQAISHFYYLLSRFTHALPPPQQTHIHWSKLHNPYLVGKEQVLHLTYALEHNYN